MNSLVPYTNRILNRSQHSLLRLSNLAYLLSFPEKISLLLLSAGYMYISEMT